MKSSHLVPLVIAIAVAVTLVAQARGQESANQNAAAQPVSGVGRLWNLTSYPVAYQLARNTGRPWTAPITIEPNKFHEFHAPKSGQRSVLLGMNQRDRFVGVRFNALGGVVTVRLPGRTPDGDIVPNWFFVQDANQIPRLVQANGPAEARAQYEQLQKVEPLNAQNIERFKSTLRANHIFADGR